jgi:phosphoribosyl 1,2-cyclic phosphodiesterase
MFSETRFNHMCGLPFFMPGYNPKNIFRVWAGHRNALGSMQRELTGMMTSPLFPIPLSYIGALKSFHDFAAGDSFEPKPGVVVRSAPLDHPNGATGYRIEYGGRALCYVSGTQHRPNRPDPTVISLIKHAHLVIYDSFYADEEYVANDVGHSTWQEGVRLCRAASARRLAPFQHNPAHDDAYLDRVQAELEAALPGSRVAAEGLVLEL